MILYIDTTGKEQLELAAITSTKTISQKFSVLPNAESFASLVESFLSKHNLSTDNIERIALRKGDGYFSRIRTGVVFANAIAYALNINIIEVIEKPDFKSALKKKAVQTIKPTYSGKPIITVSKKKYGFKN